MCSVRFYTASIAAQRGRFYSTKAYIINGLAHTPTSARTPEEGSIMASVIVIERNETAPLVLADAALTDGMSSLPDMVCVGDTIDTDMQEGFLR